MKKITYLILSLFLGGLMTANAQYSFPAVAGPTTVAEGAPVTLNINDAANGAGVPVGMYATFSVSVDWAANSGNPFDSEADLTMTTTAGSVLIDPATSGAVGSASPTTMTFEGAFTADYDPAVDGFLDIVLNQSWSGSVADWSNIVVTIIPALTCTPPAGTAALGTEDCGAGTFVIDYDITDLGDGTPVLFDGTTSFPVAAIGPGSAGPYAIGTPVTLTLQHGGDALCDVDLGTFVDNCPIFSSVDCAAGTPVNTTFCYDSNGDYLYSFTSSDGSALRVDFIEGYFEDCCDDITIYDGLTTADAVLFASDGSENNDATGITAISTGDSVLVQMVSDASVSCAAGSGSGIPLNFNVSCNTCTPATAVASVVNDCANSGGFNIEVDITDLGSATALTLSDDQGSAAQSISAIGIYTFGPFVNGTVVAVSLVDDADAACTETFSALSQLVCPPANNDCANAITVAVNADLSCTATTSGTIAGATASGEDESSCGGTEDDDVWYSFVATADTHTIDLLNVAGSTTDLYHSVWEGTCGTLTNLSCSDPNSSTVPGLTIGNTYLLRVYSWTSTAGQNTTFDVCIGTLPPPPANDDCANATVVNALPYTNTQDATGATNNAGFIDPTDASCSGNGMNDGVWYTFTPTVDGTVDVLITNVVGWDLEVAIYSGACGAYICEGRADGAGGSGSETLSDISVSNGVQYWINVGYWSDFTDSSEGPFQIDITTITLGIDDIDNEVAFTYYPNPVKNTLTLNARNTIEQVAMYNMLGQEVLRATPNTVDSDLDMSNLQTGTYFVKVTIANVTKTIRVIKQ